MKSSRASLSSPATRHTSPASLIPLSGTGLDSSVPWSVEVGSLTNQSSPNANGYDAKNASSQLRLDSSAIRDLMLTMQQAIKALSDPRRAALDFDSRARGHCRASSPAASSGSEIDISGNLHASAGEERHRLILPKLVIPVTES